MRKAFGGIILNWTRTRKRSNAFCRLVEKIGREWKTFLKIQWVKIASSGGSMHWVMSWKSYIKIDIVTSAKKTRRGRAFEVVEYKSLMENRMLR